jgi:hypothetical protein
VPGYAAAVSGALGTIEQLGPGALASPVLGTAQLVNTMMADASRLTADEIQRKYGGIGGLAGSIAAQNEIFTQWRERDIAAWTRDQAAAAAMADWQGSMEQWRAEWVDWQADLVLGSPP